MAGQIVKRGKNNFVVRIYLGRDGGKRRYLNKQVHGTRKQAEKTLTALLRERDLGKLVEPVKITLNEYLDDWLESAAKTRVRKRTHQGYTELADRYLRPDLGPRQLSKLTPLEIQAVYSQMLDRGLSARTVRHAHGVLRSALNQAVKWRMIAINPATAVDLPQIKKREMRALSPEQASKFLVHATEDRLFAMFAVAVTTGMRPGEYLGLRWSEVDLDKGLIVVVRTLVPEKKGWHIAEPKTDRGRRTIPLPSSVTRALIWHQAQQAAEQLKAGKSYTDHHLVFTTPTGEPLNLRNIVNRHFKPILETAGLPKELRLYDLRHSCATLLLAEGEHPKVVSERLGHASITLTLDTYSHVLPTMQQRAAERLEEALFSRGKS